MNIKWVSFILIPLIFIIMTERTTIDSFANTEGKLLEDKVNGFSLIYPRSMQVDTSLQPIRTVLQDAYTKIEIYYDHFTNTLADSAIYMSYSNQMVIADSHHTVENDETRTINGMTTHMLKWHREKLAKISNDKNYYVSIEIARTNREVYTILMKSSQPINNESVIMNSFKFIEKTETKPLDVHFKELPVIRSDETLQMYNHHFKSNRLRWGIYQPDAPDSFTNLKQLEANFQHTFDYLVRYQSIQHELPKQALKNAWDQHRLVELTLQTLSSDHKANFTYDILNGNYDTYFQQYAADLKAFGHPVLFRLNNEMNGDWVGYSAYYSSKDTDLYKAVWTYVYDMFLRNGVDNVIWVWNPNHESKPGFAWNHELMYYPGDEYVDVIGLTAYNTGNYYETVGEKWRTFKELYEPLYQRYALWSDKPLMITEFASSSIGGDKEAWIRDMFRVIPQYPKIRAAIWWNGIDWDGDTPARIYTLDDDKAMMDTLRQGFK
ncbi:glycoside hydrolase family 26 protein [Paenibacillus roseipurpureus]|uniref:Glycosyl hydrolase n=1 Tax=Paenibacillus roseopurpureus TaxID=2918901 RepID=A0AA96LJX2_9BACL|nr:glycosyl hydrolase [Paenibacillus sp. MBLB1832]WNR42056.1 glycosyl hydrolase [Paenibacillus sp. MBLB1832]